MADEGVDDARVEDDPDSPPVPSARQMGVIRVGNALHRAAGTMPQRAAAVHFGVPYGTMCALMRFEVRNYGARTLHKFDEMIGRDTWILYQEDDEPGHEVAAASQADLDVLRARLAELDVHLGELRVELSELYTTREPDLLEVLAGRLDDAERAEVISYIHFLLGRRRPG